MGLAVLVLVTCSGVWSSASEHVALKDSLQTGVQSMKGPTLLSTRHNASALGGKSGRSMAVQELLGILAREMQNKQPLDKFLPTCLAHIKKLVKVMDQAYTDVQLQFMLEHECWLVKTFPHAYSHGFESHRACKCFSEKLSAARMWELHDGSQHRYEEFCTAYFNDPNAEGIEECAGEFPSGMPSGGEPVQPLKQGSPELGAPEEMAEAAAQPGQAPLGAKTPGEPLGVASPVDIDKSASPSPSQEAVVASKQEPTVEPPLSLPTEEDQEEMDKEIERQMKEMQDRVKKDVESAEKAGELGVATPEGEKARLEAERKRKQRNMQRRPGQAIDCPYKSGSYEWCDYIIDGEPYYKDKDKAWDSKSSATKLERLVEHQTEEGDGPEPHAIIPSDEPLPPWARKKIEEARARNKAKEASHENSQEAYARIENHWAQMRKRSKKKAEYQKAYQDRYRTQWERMQKVAEQKRLRDQAEKEIAYDSKSWPWPKDDPEWDHTEVQQKPKKAAGPAPFERKPTHSSAVRSASPLVLLIGIVLSTLP